MFKIVGQFSCEPNEERKFLVVDNKNLFTVQNLSTMRQLLCNLPEDAMVEVGSFSNYSVSKVLAKTCITKSTGRLSYRGADVIEIGEISGLKITENPIVINGVDLGKAAGFVMYGYSAASIEEYGKALEEDMAVIYFPKIDYLHFLPFCDNDSDTYEPYCSSLKEIEGYLNSWVNMLSCRGLFFKMSGAFREEYTNVKSDSSKLFIYGMVESGNLHIVDRTIKGLPLSRLLTHLESNHFIGKIPCLLGHSTGKLSKKGERVAYKNMFGPEIIRAFRKDDEVMYSGELEPLEGSRTMSYSVSPQAENVYGIQGYDAEANLDKKMYYGILHVNNTTGLPEVEITYKK